MTLLSLFDWEHPAVTGDRGFFQKNRMRKYRARPFSEGESIVPLFTADELGALGEVNLIIIKRVERGRARRLFSTQSTTRFLSDRAIVAFLRSRGIKPTMFCNEVR